MDGFRLGPEESLAGRPARFDVTVHEVKAKRLPELDDDFAAEAGGFDSLDELRQAVPRHRADVAIVDLELASLNDVVQFKREFSATTIVCTHRLADEKMWMDALAAGASDCCYSSDVRAIVLAASNTKPLSHAHAA